MKYKNMIDVKELKVGNLIIPKNGSPRRFSILDFRDIVRGIIDESYFDPIPITEEWLLRFGVHDNTTYEEYWEFDDCTWIKYLPTKHGGSGKFVFVFVQGRNEIEIEVSFIHQLQNLYFPLTGEELQEIGK